MEKYQLEHTTASSTHSRGIIDLYNITKDSSLHSMENIIPSEPLNERNMCRKENVLLCDKCSGQNVKLCESVTIGVNVILSQSCSIRRGSVVLDYIPSSMSDNRGNLLKGYPKSTGCHRVTLQEYYSLYFGSHGIHSSEGNSSKRTSDNRVNLLEDYSECTGSHRIHSSKGNFSRSMRDIRILKPMDYQECIGSHEGYSCKCYMELPNTCRISGQQSQSSLSEVFHCLTRCSQTRSSTYSNPSVINHMNPQKGMESIRQITYNRIEDTLHHSSPTVPCTQKDRYIHGKSDELTVFQPLVTQDLSKKSQDFTLISPDKLPFQVPTKWSSVTPKCSPVTSKGTFVTSFQHKMLPQPKSLPSEFPRLASFHTSHCTLVASFWHKMLPQQHLLSSQCNSTGANPALFLYHSAVTLMKRTTSSSVFINSLLTLLFMFALLPLSAHSATNGIPCLYKGSLKSDRSWFGFLTNITIMNTGRMTFQFSYPAEKCCQNILFYLEDQVSILNARMNCWQKESLLRPEDDQILRLTPRFSWSGCHLSHPNGFVGLYF